MWEQDKSRSERSDGSLRPASKRSPLSSMPNQFCYLPTHSPFQTDKSFKQKIRLEKDTWQIFMAFISPPNVKRKKNAGQMMWPSWDRLSTVSLGWPCKKQTGSMVAASRLHGEEEGKGSAVVFTNKKTFCFPFAFQLKSATNMEIHYRQLRQNCDQSLCSQFGTGSWGRCLSTDGQKTLCQLPCLSFGFLDRMGRWISVFTKASMCYVFIPYLRPYGMYL